MMNRNLLFFAIILLSRGDIAAQKTTVQHSPNIIFILADDLGYGDIGCFGQQKINTPHIDALAKNGIKFTQFYSGSTVCAPSRASFMTGLHTGHTPVRGNITLQPEGQVPLPDSSITIAMELQKAGYKTGAFGKWSLGYITSSGAPSKKGFETFFGYNCQSLAHNYYPDHLWDNEKRVDFPANPTKLTVYSAEYSADLIHQKAMEFINRQTKATPFFLYLPYTIPHADLTPPHDSIYNYYVQLFNDEPLKETDKRNLNKQFVELYPHAAFAAMITRLDRYVGDIVALIAKKGMAENTLIIFASDNGPHQEKGGDPEFFHSNGIYRGIKRDLYEGGIRVPMIACWKGKITPGRSSDHVAAFWDLFPTFQQVAHLPGNKNIDGISILPTLLNKSQLKHNYLYWEFHESGGRQAVRWKNWKAIKLNVSTAKAEATELYDIVKDPSEKQNLAALHPDIVKKMEQFLKEAHQKNPDWILLPEEKDVYMFSYFKGNGQDGLHLAYSYDGYTFTALKNDSSFLRPVVSKDKLMRDPCILKGPDGLFHMVWTVSWNAKGIGYASSPDLLRWSEQQYIPVMEKEDSARNCWAPEINYDPAKKEYMIYWATTITGKFPSDTSVERGYNHRIYYVTTKDLKAWSATKLLYDKGFNVIDASIVPYGKRFIMFLKDETLKPVAQKNIRIATSNQLDGDYGLPGTSITGNYWAEGPTATRVGNEWIVYFDKYRDHRYGAVTSSDLVNWTDISDKIRMPPGIRHGTVFTITRKELEVLLK